MSDPLNDGQLLERLGDAAEAGDATTFALTWARLRRSRTTRTPGPERPAAAE